MSVHSWCRDVQRDEAVRASEDNRPGPLPTLEEAISGVTERRPVDAGGRGNVTGGLRTERVTLEITRPVFANYPTSAFEFMWGHLLRDVVKGDRESVRAVDTHAEEVAQSVAWEGARDAYRGRIARLTAERDAAIRERDKLRAERITQALTADRFASAVAEAERLRARVAELEAAAKLAPAANADGGSNQSAPAASGNVEKKPMKMPSRAWFERMASVDDSEMSVGGLASRVTELESSAPAASGAAGTGCLTAEERLAVSGAILILDQHGPTNIGHSLNALLARSSPPEAVRPKRLEDMRSVIVDQRDAEWLAALAAAGVKVKEVGRE